MQRPDPILVVDLFPREGVALLQLTAAEIHARATIEGGGDPRLATALLCAVAIIA